jgi:hypothetical protein
MHFYATKTHLPKQVRPQTIVDWISIVQSECFFQSSWAYTWSSAYNNIPAGGLKICSDDHVQEVQKKWLTRGRE